MNATASTPSTAARDVDSRGFSYPLEPVRQRQQWQLDRCLAALGRAQTLLDQTEAQLKQLRETHDAQARALSEATLRRSTPAPIGAHSAISRTCASARRKSRPCATRSASRATNCAANAPSGGCASTAWTATRKTP